MISAELEGSAKGCLIWPNTEVDGREKTAEGRVENRRE